ncbi:MAG TPA: tetratricopeptide repeat protein, partial [Planctomycetota bacterium]|nr:tetratricopeptide repeat protein [Planctomycetota bacterium]
ASFANDPNETQIQYDLYRIPFNAGAGGTPRPVEGASNNGMSHAFPRFSPDGEWIVFVRCRNGLLMRPDGKLYIIPAEGGRPRLMSCNTPRMNSHHSFSPNGRWMVFASKWPTPYTQMYLTHIDDDGRDTPPVLVPNSTAANRAVNLPEFANIPPGGLVEITTPAAEYRRHLDRGRDLFEAKRYDEALAELEKSLARRDDYAETYYTCAYVRVEQNRLEEAIPYFEKAIALDPGHYHAHNNLGIVLSRLGRPEAALVHFGAALRIDPRQAATHVNLGIVLNQLGRPEAALVHLEAALRIDPRQAATHANLGIVLSQLGKTDEAVRHFARSAEMDPTNPKCCYEWGIALVRARDLEGAVEHFRKAVELDDRYTKAHHDWGVALAMLNRADEAEKHFKRALEIDPEFYLAHESLGRLMTRRKKYAEAVGHYRAALKISPRYESARDSLAWLLATAPDAEVRNGAEAVRHAEIACKSTGNRNPGFLLTLAAAQAEAGRFDEATQTAGTVLDMALEAGNEGLTGTARACIERFRQKEPIRITP